MSHGARLRTGTRRGDLRRSQFIGPNDTDPLLEDMPGESTRRSRRRKAAESSWSGIVASIGLIVASVALGLVIWQVVRTGDSSIDGDVGDNLVLENVTITNLDVDGVMNLFDLTDSVPTPTVVLSTAKKRNGERITNQVLDWRKTETTLKGGEIHLSIPKNCRRYRNKDYIIRSGDYNMHRLIITPNANWDGDDDDNDYNDFRGRRCDPDDPITCSWDKDNQYPVIKFDGDINCFVIFRVLKCHQIILRFSRGISLCPDTSGVGCVRPKSDINADNATIVNGTADNLTVQNLVTTMTSLIPVSYMFLYPFAVIIIV